MISPATPVDLPALAELEREVFTHEVYPAFFFRQAMDLWPRWLLVAREPASEIAAYVLAAPAADASEAWLLSAATASTHRGRGLGGNLLAALLARLRADGVRVVRLTVRPENPARRLYERHGFRLESEHAHYFGPGEPRLRLKLDLTLAASLRPAEAP